MITEKAYAKVNLSLDVTGKRPDGYHEVCMIMQTIALHDTLTFKMTQGDGIILSTDSAVLNSEQDSGRDNLIIKAARRLSEYAGKPLGAEIKLTKNIPIAAGMAGGSSDAAAALRGLNRLYELNLSEEELCSVAVKIGADVPFCVKGGLYLSEGIGEVLTELPKITPEIPVVICKPSISVSTKEVYTAFDSLTDCVHPDVLKMAAEIKNDNPQGIIPLMGNVLENVTKEMHPVIGEIEKNMEALGAERAMMSGSGPTVFGLFKDAQEAEAAAGALRDIYPKYDICATSFVTPEK